jgi:fatty-acyl-CoA synthase
MRSGEEEPNPFVGATYGTALARIAAVHGEREALVFGGRRWTFADVLVEIERAAARLFTLDLRPGDSIAIWLSNRPDFLWYWLGAARSGLVPVVLNARLRPDEAAYQIGQSDSRALIVPGDGAFRDFVADVEAVRDRLPALRHVVALDPTRHAGVLDWSIPAPADLPAAPVASDPDAPALISYSSGTTALPKGAMITHCVFRKAWDIGTRVDLSCDERLALAIPLFGSMAMMNGVLPFWVRGAAMVLLERFEAASFVETVRAERCTMAHLLPPMVLQLAEVPAADRSGLSSLRVAWVLSNDAEVLAIAADRLGIPGVMTGYGLTETTTVLTRNRWDDPREARFETQGRPLPGIDLRVVDPRSGETCAPGVPGEIRVRGYCVMKGYYRKPQETAAVIDGDGWLRTGDVGVMREDGRLTFLHRLGDGYKTNGFNVSPAEVESVLRRHPAIADVAVFGRADPAAGQVGVACVVVRPGVRFDERDILAFARPLLSSYKIPRFVVRVDELPMTSGTGKVQKGRLRESVEPLLDAVRP